MGHTCCYLPSPLPIAAPSNPHPQPGPALKVQRASAHPGCIPLKAGVFPPKPPSTERPGEDPCPDRCHQTWQEILPVTSPGVNLAWGTCWLQNCHLHATAIERRGLRTYRSPQAQAMRSGDGPEVGDRNSQALHGPAPKVSGPRWPCLQRASSLSGRSGVQPAASVPRSHGSGVLAEVLRGGRVGGSSQRVPSGHPWVPRSPFPSSSARSPAVLARA